MTFSVEVFSGSRAYKHFMSGCSGKIIGVFSSSVYLQVENGEILLLHQDKFGVIPFGIGLSDITSFLSAAGFSVNTEFCCSNLQFYITGSERKIVFQLKKNPLVSAHGESLNPYIIQERIIKAEELLKSQKPECMSIIYSLLNDYNATEPAGGPCIGDLTAIDVFNSLIQGIIHDYSEKIEFSLYKLIGLGYGLTPTMDDVLTGLVYIIRFFKRKTGEFPAGGDTFFNLLKTERLYSRTSAISSAYFRSAASGEFFSLFEDVVISLTSETDTERTNDLIGALLAIGSDSGGNILAGILMGLDKFSFLYV